MSAESSANAKTTRSSRTTKKAAPTATELAEAYVAKVLEHGSRPASVFKFAREQGISEGQFYEHFSSFEAVEAALWKGFMEQTLEGIRNDENFQAFTSREKLLAFYYAHIEVLKQQRSFVKFVWSEWKNPVQSPQALKAYREGFRNFVKEVVSEGLQSQEIKERPMLSERYDQAFWVQLIFVMNFWLNDTSAGFERTDAAIEKAVNLSFDLIGQTTLDSFIDFAKFVFQSRN